MMKSLISYVTKCQNVWQSDWIIFNFFLLTRLRPLSFLKSLSWFLILVLIFISLVKNDNNFHICLLITCFLFAKYLFKHLIDFINGFLLLRYKSSLHMIDRISSDTCLKRIFPSIASFLLHQMTCI